MRALPWRIDGEPPRRVCGWRGHLGRHLCVLVPGDDDERVDGPSLRGDAPRGGRRDFGMVSDHTGRAGRAERRSPRPRSSLAGMREEKALMNDAADLRRARCHCRRAAGGQLQSCRTVSCRKSDAQRDTRKQPRASPGRLDVHPVLGRGLLAFRAVPFCSVLFSSVPGSSVGHHRRSLLSSSTLSLGYEPKPREAAPRRSLAALDQDK